MGEKIKPMTAREIATEMCKRSKMRSKGKEFNVTDVMHLNLVLKELMKEKEAALMGHVKYNGWKSVELKNGRK